MPIPESSTRISTRSPAAAATRGYTITSFDSIRVDAPVTVTLVTGQGPSARAEGDQAMLDRLHVDVSGRTLSITADRLRSGEKGGGTAIVRVSTGMLDRVMLTGGGSMLKNLDKRLREETGLPLAMAEDPLSSVVLGAGKMRCRTGADGEAAHGRSP